MRNTLIEAAILNPVHSYIPTYQPTSVVGNNIRVLWRLERNFYHTGCEVSNCTLMVMP